MNLETKITIYKFTPQVFTLTRVLFWLRKRRGTENMAPLYCRVTITGQRDKPHHRTDCEAPE